MINTQVFLGIKYSDFTLQDIENDIIYNIRNGVKKIVYGYSLTLLPKFKIYPDIYFNSVKFDYFLTDGKGFYYFLRFFGIKLKNDLSLPDFAELLLNIANENNFSVLLLGGEKNSNITATNNLRKKYSNAIILEGIDGYFGPDKETVIIERINRANPDIVLIGISSPKKERIAVEWKNKLNAKIIVPCGGVIDIFAGKTKREPKIIKILGVTWLYRFFQEPFRLFKPILISGISVLFGLIPRTIYEVKIKKNHSYTIPGYYINKFFKN